MQSWFFVVFMGVLTLGCAEPYGYGGYGYADYNYGADVAPVTPPPGGRYISPRMPAPGSNWGWAYHPEHGYGWHHEQYGWRHERRD